ncbi:MAG: thioredoxin domain-containing protein [Gammaproteobacteria bacterium]|nr:thioredoxin domain-containing protein [Gammaproteobacteria bacterium]
MLKQYITVILCLFALSAAQANSSNNGINWTNWSADLFEQAKAQNRYVILDLEAVWCHWCHVMDEKTYSDAAVQKLLKEHYISVRVDQDARPDLANRYRQYGWPATIIFSPDGTEIVKRAGYIAPENMTRLLQAIVDDPSPEQAAKLDLPERFAEESTLGLSLLQQLELNHTNIIDTQAGGLLTTQKYIERDSLEYAIKLARAGDKKQKQWAKLTLDQALNLFDPVWGGVYQYSTHGDWEHQHYEKIIPVQAAYLRAYTHAWSLWKLPRYKNATDNIVRYIDKFLTSPEGAFYTSQDADVVKGQHSNEYFKLDDQQRRKIGIPAIDRHIYARENGMMIEALAYLYEVTGEQSYLDKAITAAKWVTWNRTIKEGGYSHGRNDTAGPYLGDNLAMSKALLQLYRATGNKNWLTQAIKTTQFINKHFKYNDAGFIPVIAKGQAIKPVPQLDENISVTRLSNMMFHYTGLKQFKKMAVHGMRYLATPAVATSRLTESGILLADDELRQDPMHITVIGYKNNKLTKALYKTALRTPVFYKRLEWWDTREGKLINQDIQYPALKKTAAFVCNDGRCSLPLYNASEIQSMLN